MWRVVVVWVVVVVVARFERPVRRDMRPPERRVVVRLVVGMLMFFGLLVGVGVGEVVVW